MKYLLKTSYMVDIRLFDRIHKYCLLLFLIILLCLIPPLIGSYSIAPYLIYTLSLSGIYVVLILGLNLLVGYTGQISLCHSALLAIGAYSTAILSENFHFPFLLVMAVSGFIAAFAGMLVGIPALRLKELYLAIATMGFGFIIDEIILQWESLTHGSYGYSIDRPVVAGHKLSDVGMYYCIILIVVAFTIITKNIVRSPLGRAFISIRDSEISAQALGIDVPKYKVMAFGISSFYAGVAGSLYAYCFTFIGPDNFSIWESILYLIMVIIGGLGSIPGSIMGALFITILPESIRVAKNYLPYSISTLVGIDTIFYAGILIMFIVYEPTGIYGRWLKVKYHANTFPLYRKQTFKRVKKFHRKEIK
jgi:branched-chain amino acid transport system permease protein